MSTLVEKGIFSEEDRPENERIRVDFDVNNFLSSKVVNVLFGMTPLTKSLLSDAPYSVRNVCLQMGDPAFFGATGQMLETVKTGKPGFEIVHKTGPAGMYDHFEKNKDVALVYHNCMEQLCNLGDSALLFSYDFSSYKTVVDVGGGSGALLGRVLKKNPESRGVLFESVHALEGAKQKLSDFQVSYSDIIDCSSYNQKPDQDLSSRCLLISGDFLKEMPVGGDCYILKNILMDLQMPASVSILKAVVSSMPAHARVLIIQPMVPLSNKPHMGRINGTYENTLILIKPFLIPFLFQRSC
jgi:hypothetical protein